jgi:uncharacterized protein (TIGR03437 family)
MTLVVSLLALSITSSHLLANDSPQWTHTRRALAASPARQSYHVYTGDHFERNVTRIAVDKAGATYLTGSRIIYTNSAGAPVEDIFVTKLNPAGEEEFTITISGKNSDRANGIALDPFGNIVICGTTSSPNFPLVNAIQSEGSSTGFILKLSPDGGRIIFSTRFGGTRSFSTADAIATDAAGAIFVTGSTYSSDFPTNGPDHPLFGIPIIGGAYVAKLDPLGRLLWTRLIIGSAVSCGAGSSCFLSTRNTAGVDLAIDAAGAVYLAGNTNTTDLPTTPQAFLRSGIGAFVAKLNNNDGQLAYLTYIGATNYILTPFSNPANRATGITVDRNGRAIVVGATSDPKFPATAGAYQTSLAGSSNADPFQPSRDAFALAFDTTGSNVAWGTYLGSAQEDSASRVSIDAAGNLWITGRTESPAFPNVQGWTTGPEFLAALDSTATQLLWSARYPTGTIASDITTDGNWLHYAGQTGWVTQAIARQPDTGIFATGNAAGGPLSARLSPYEVISIYGRGIGPTQEQIATATNGRLPTALAGFEVRIDGAPIPLLYAGPNQINAIVPSNLSASPRLSIVTAASNTGLGIIAVDDTPQIFRYPATNRAVAVNQDGTFNSPDNPARAGTIVALWVTGAGGTSSLQDGEIATTPMTTGCCQVTVGSTPATVVYSGTAPGAANGVSQVNFQLPATLAPGVTNVTVSSRQGRAGEGSVIFVQ